MPAKLKITNTDDICRRYIAGESEQKIAKDFGFDRQVIQRVLRENGIPRRSMSAAQQIKNARMSPEDRARQTAAAHEAAKGRKATLQERIQRAQTIEQRQLHTTPAETQLAIRLSALFDVTQQKAVGKYNIDIALNEPPVAVELFGGSWHQSGNHIARFHERVKYLLNSGWSVLIVWVDGLRYPLSVGCDKYVIRFANELRGNPSAISQYRVILGNGDTAPVAKRYLNTPADIERFSRPD